MSKFACGDRVVYIGGYSKEEALGVHGEVIAIEPNGGRCGVRFDKNIDGHTLAKQCEYGYGWWFPGTCLALEESALPDIGDLF